MSDRMSRDRAALQRWAPPALATVVLLMAIWSAGGALAAEQNVYPAQVGTQPTPTPTQQMQRPQRPDAVAEMSALLVDALLAREYATPAQYATAEMRLVTWLSSRRVVEADEVLQDLEELWLGPAPDPYLDLSTDLTAFFGLDPSGLWGNDWPVEQVLFLRGLAADGRTDALLAVVRTADGAPAWGGLLIAPEGFGLPAAEHAALPTLPAPTPGSDGAEPKDNDAAGELAGVSGGRVRILRTTNIYPAAEFDLPPTGLMRSGQVVDLLEIDGFGEYLRVACPSGVDDPCWIVNDPAAVAILEGFVSAAGPTEAEAPGLPQAATDDEPIVFGAGVFAATRTGLVSGLAPRTYELYLAARQMAYFTLSSPQDVANFSLIGLVNGQPYKRIADESRSLSFVVPVTQKYSIRIEAPADQVEPVEYALTVVVLPAPSLPPSDATASPTPTPAATLPPTATPSATPSVTFTAPAPTPVPPVIVTPVIVAPEAVTPFLTPIPTAEVVVFAPDQSTVEVGGQVGPGRSTTYSVAGPQGATLQISIASDQRAAMFTVAGASDGVIYSSLDDRSNPFVMYSPRTQEYLITVMSPWNVEFLLTITVLTPAYPLPTSTPLPADSAAPARLVFEPGAVEARSSAIVAPWGSARYVVAGMAGQEATFALASPDGIADFELRDPGGILLKPLEGENRRWEGVLPQGGDYSIDIYNPRGVRVQYTLAVSVLPAGEAQAEPTAVPVTYERITFGAGEESATLTGSLPAAGINGYVLRAVAGQTLSASVESPQADVGLTVVAPDGTPLKRGEEGLPFWSGVLPATGDYLLLAVALGPDATYELTVRVTN